MAESSFDVIVNGGGPVGMGLALELGLRGISVAVVERAENPPPVPKGQNLTQRTAEHFRVWGCEQQLREAHPLPEGAGIGGMTCYDTLLSPYHYDWLNRSHVQQYYHAANARLPQYATEGVLRARAAEVSGIKTFFGWSGTAFAGDAEGVSLTMQSSGGAETRVLRGRYLVGCDGSHSLIRREAGLTETRSDHNRLMALVVFRSEALHTLLMRYPGKAFYNVLHPDYDGYWQFFGRVDHGLSWFFHAPVPEGTTADNFDFSGLLERAVGQPFAHEIEYIGFWALRVAHADSYRAGRVLIAGDAAHSHPPYGGYGINTGLEDSRNLGWKLAATIQGWGGPGLLDSYGAERHPVFASTARDFIESYIEDDRTFLRSYSPTRDQAAFERAWADRNLAGGEVDAFEPHYEGSPIVAGPPGMPSARGGHQMTARAGHHLAPATLSDGQDVFDALGPGFTLLVDGVGELAHAFDAAARVGNVPLRIAPETGDAMRTVYNAGAILIRPDHFVAWAGEDGDASEILARATGHADMALAGQGDV